MNSSLVPPSFKYNLYYISHILWPFTFSPLDWSHVKSFLETLFCRSLLALVFPVLNSLFDQGITNCVLSWKRTLKLISNPFNELRIPFDGLLFKLPGKLRNWQSGSHPCFTLYINNWPKPQLRNGSPQKSWRSDRTFFQGLHHVGYMTWSQLEKLTWRDRFLDVLDPIIIHGDNWFFWPVDWFTQPDFVKTLKYFCLLKYASLWRPRATLETLTLKNI